VLGIEDVAKMENGNLTAIVMSSRGDQDCRISTICTALFQSLETNQSNSQYFFFSLLLHPSITSNPISFCFMPIANSTVFNLVRNKVELTSFTALFFHFVCIVVNNAM